MKRLLLTVSGPPAKKLQRLLFSPVTLTSDDLMYELDLKILKMNLTCMPKINFLGQSFQKLQNYRQTDATAFTGGKINIQQNIRK